MPPAVHRIELQPIGHVRTAYRRMEDTPIQTGRNPGEPGRLVVEERYTAALDGLEGFDYAHRICFLDQVWEADDRGTRDSGWLDHVRAGWYQQHDTAANPLIRPGRQGLRAAGLDPPPG